MAIFWLGLLNSLRGLVYVIGIALSVGIVVMSWPDSEAICKSLLIIPSLLTESYSSMTFIEVLKSEFFRGCCYCDESKL